MGLRQQEIENQDTPVTKQLSLQADYYLWWSAVVCKLNLESLEAAGNTKYVEYVFCDLLLDSYVVYHFR